MNQNQKAFLDTIAYSEGTYGIGDDGYNVLVGSTKTHPLLFPHYNDHPRIFNRALKSTAAGRYQLLAHWFDAYKVKLKLKDFSPASQDAIALQQIKECRGIDNINAGNFELAIAECNNIWASLPGAGYHQHENKIDDLFAFYAKVGGQVAI